jgi:predicted RNA methylase
MQSRFLASLVFGDRFSNRAVRSELQQPPFFSQSGQSDNTLVHSASSEQQLVAACHLSSIYSYRRTLDKSHSHLFPKISKAAVCYLSLFVLLV